jgi:hypothetical protein
LPQPLCWQLAQDLLVPLVQPAPLVLLALQDLLVLPVQTQKQLI